MAIPQHKFVSSILPTHLGYPDCGWYSDNWAASTYMNWEEGLPPITMVQQCLQYGVNPQRVSITHTLNAPTATLVWESGAHDFVVGDYVRVCAQGSGSATTNDYFEVVAAPDTTHATISVPTGVTFPTISSSATEDLDYTYLAFALTGNGSITDEIVSQSRGYTLGGIQNHGGVLLSSDVQRYGTTSYDFNADTRCLGFVTRAVLSGCADLTVDAWVHPVSAGSGTRFIFGWHDAHSGESSVGLVYDADTRAIGWKQGGVVVSTSPDTLPLNQWSHVAATRKDGYISLFVNGVKQVTPSYRSSWSVMLHVACVGGTPNSGTNFPGYIQCFRLYKGKARWTASFPTASVDYSPTLRYGVGYFAVRGGNILRPITHAPQYPGGYPPYNSYTGALPQFFQLRAYYDAAPSVAPVYAISGYGTVESYFTYTYAMHPASFSRLNWNGIVSFGEHPALAANVAPKIKFAFVFSDAGFYQYMRCHTYNHNGYRAHCSYFGKSINFCSTAGMTDQEAILASCVHFSYSSLDVSYSSEAIRANRIDTSSSWSDGTCGLLMAGSYSAPVGKEYSVNASNGAASLVKVIHPSDPTSHIGGLGAGLLGALNSTASLGYLGNTYANASAALLGRGMVLAKPTAVLGDSLMVSPPGSLWVVGGAPGSNITLPFGVATRTTAKLYGDSRDCVYMPGHNTYGVVSLHVQDWETR